MTPTEQELAVGKWEYRVANFALKAKGLGARGIGKVEDIEAELNALGADSWELVTVFAPTAMGTGMGIVAVLKRPVA